MKNRLIIIGAGGHAKVVADIAEKSGYTDICFVDDTKTGSCVGFPVIGKIDDVEKLNDSKTDFVIGIGNNEIRKAIAHKYNVNYVTLIHPSAQIAVNVTFGIGTVVMAGAVVNPDTVIKNHCILNTSCVVEHDNVIEDYVHISPNVALGGTAHICEGTHVGIGATIVNNITVCAGCRIGAGAVVVKSIEKSGTYIGVPAKELV